MRNYLLHPEDLQSYASEVVSKRSISATALVKNLEVENFPKNLKVSDSRPLNLETILELTCLFYRVKFFTHCHILRIDDFKFMASILIYHFC